jgi:hypothetical protein
MIELKIITMVALIGTLLIGLRFSAASARGN